jgi:hypothetical protein
MRDIRSQVLQIGVDLRIDVHELSDIQRTHVLDDVFAKYTQGYRYAWAMWDSRYFAPHVSRQAEDGWEWCADFIGMNQAFLFFNSAHEEAMFAIAGGHAVVRLLGEMPAEEFYLTNTLTDYLLCVNHHDYLIACGRAREWLTAYQPAG